MIRRLLQRDDGAAVVVVLAVVGVLSLLVAVSFALARRSLQVAAAEADVHGALAAAEAGLDDYLFRLGAHDEYWRYGASADGMPPPPDGNEAFERFVPIPGGASDGAFTYRVDPDRLQAEGVLVLESTGRSGGRERTISAVLRQESFLDYVYFTDYETRPPISYATPEDQEWAGRECAVHRWVRERPSSGLPSDPSRGCTEIFWTGVDVIRGPWHSNDRFRIDGSATWEQSATSSDPRDPPYDLTSGTPAFQPGDPRFRDVLPMPPSNADLVAEADHRLGGGGCLFTGPTQILLRADGLLDVTSPHTRESGPGCGDWGSAGGGTQRISPPANGVIYVQAVPPAGDPNHSPTCAAAPGTGNGLGYPSTPDDPWTYGCGDGDVFVEGSYRDRLTIGAQHDVIITWHLERAGPDAMLGLAPNDHVAVYHPVTCAETGAGGACTRWATADAAPLHPGERFTDPRIDAAMISLRASFLVQSWGLGHLAGGGCDPLGTLTVQGAIVQRFRGPVGTYTGSGGAQCTGYAKDYRYDQRFAFSTPPSFIDPARSSWRAVRVAEQFDG